MTGTNPVAERAQWVHGFNDMMVKIWKEQVVRLDVFSTLPTSGLLYRTVRFTHSKMDGAVTDVHLSYEFAEYGVYVDRGTGREIPRENPGDIGRPKVRQPKRWMSPKFFKSYYRIRNYFAESLGREFCAAIPRILGATTL